MLVSANGVSWKNAWSPLEILATLRLPIGRASTSLWLTLTISTAPTHSLPIKNV